MTDEPESQPQEEPPRGVVSPPFPVRVVTKCPQCAHQHTVELFVAAMVGQKPPEQPRIIVPGMKLVKTQ